MSRKRKQQDTGGGGGGAPGWMTTFSDMMTLLLTFFILLYSISSVDAVKFKNISASLQSVLMGEKNSSILEEEGTVEDIPLDEPKFDESEAPDEVVPEDEQLRVDKETLDMYEKVEEYVTEKGLLADVTVSLNENGVFVNIKEAILFEPGRASLIAGGQELLDSLEDLFLQFENKIVVEGHTDDVPMSSAMYPSNWELSSGRAIQVVRYLSEVKSIPNSRLSAVAYGEYRPMVPNDSAENRALNRRVNLLIIMEGDGR